MYSIPFLRYVKSLPPAMLPAYVYTKEIEFQLEMFKQFPADCCQLVFNDYIHLYTIPQESVYITAITSILEGKTNPNNIFSKQLQCSTERQHHGYCRELNSNSCCYSYLVLEVSPLQIHQEIYINFASFKNSSLNDLMNIFVKEKV